MKSQHLIILLLIVLVACNSKKQKEELKVTVVPQDSVQMVEEPEPEPEPVEEVDRGVNLDDKYFIVVDSYTVEAFAESWKKKYEAQGYKPAVIMRNEDGYYRLAIQSFNEFDQAQDALDNLKKEEEFGDAWIMVINK